MNEAVSQPDATRAATGRLRVLMTHWDGGGNIPPQRALARELIRRGHDIHVLTHDSLSRSVAADGATHHRLPTAPQWDPAESLAHEQEGAFIGRNIVGSADYASDFLHLTEALAPDVCLLDSMLLTCLNAAHEKGLRYGVINHLGWNPQGNVAAMLGSVLARLPGVPEGATFFSLIERGPLVIATTYPELGRRPSRASHVHFVGPIRETAEVEPWPRRFPDRPFVLASLSTIFQQQEATLANICEALSPLPIEALVTTGRGIKPESLPVSGGVEARSFVPHDAVLPFAGLTIGHGGLGTIMYSLGAGKPCLCLGAGRDQADNAARVEALGLGRALAFDATPSEIRKAVSAMLADENLAAACRAFAARVSRFGDLARAADLVEDCADATEARERPRRTVRGL